MRAAAGVRWPAQAERRPALSSLVKVVRLVRSLSRVLLGPPLGLAFFHALRLGELHVPEAHPAQLGRHRARAGLQRVRRDVREAARAGGGGGRRRAAAPRASARPCACPPAWRRRRAGAATRGATTRTVHSELTREQGRGAGDQLTNAQRRWSPAEIEMRSASRAARRRAAAAHGPIHPVVRRRARAHGPSAARCTAETAG